jgi:hypothetical protein
MMNAGRRRLHISIIIGLAATLLCFSAAGAQSDTSSGPVTEIANIRFYSDELLNLHHTLYAAAWARRPAAETGRALAWNLPAPLDAPLTPAERAVWDHAVKYYDKNVASRDLLFGRGMVALKAALVAGDLASPDVDSALREVLESAAPIYRSR